MGSPEILPAFRELKVYPTQQGRGAFLRMDFNEGPSPDLEPLAKALALCAFSATLYPEYGPLKQAAARAWDVEPANLLPVNGADEGIALLLRAFTGPGDAVVLPVPTFPMYRIYAEQCGTPVLAVPLAADFTLDLQATLEAIPQGAILSLVSPNNPTGRAIPEVQLLEILEAAGDRPVLVDETYGPFCNQDFAPLLARYPNLILLRTLSKAHGLPGLRCGFILAQPSVIAQLEPLRPPFNLNGIAAQLGTQVISANPGLRARLQGAVKARMRLQTQLEALGIASIPSDTHFFLLDLGTRATSGVAALRAQRILVKDLATTLPGFLRISVTCDQDTDLFLNAFLPWWEATVEAQP